MRLEHNTSPEETLGLQMEVVEDGGADEDDEDDEGGDDKKSTMIYQVLTLLQFILLWKLGKCLLKGTRNCNPDGVRTEPVSGPSKADNAQQRTKPSIRKADIRWIRFFGVEVHNLHPSGHPQYIQWISEVYLSSGFWVF